MNRFNLQRRRWNEFPRADSWRPIASAFCLVAATLLVAGCATTSVDVVWSSPDFTARKVEGKVLVVGLTRDEAMRRVYEDEMVAQLAVRKIDAIRSYELVQGAFGADGTRAILNAAKREGAAAVISSAMVGHEHLARVTVEEPPTHWYGMYEGWYRFYWPYLYQRTEVRVTERYFGSTSVINVGSGKIRWTVRTHTDASGNAGRDVKDFAATLLEALGKGGLL